MGAGRMGSGKEHSILPVSREKKQRLVERSSDRLTCGGVGELFCRLQKNFRSNGTFLVLRSLAPSQAVG